MTQCIVSAGVRDNSLIARIRLFQLDFDDATLFANGELKSKKLALPQIM